MLLALAILLTAPAAASPAPAVSLPIQRESASFAILTPAPVHTPVPDGDSKSESPKPDSNGRAKDGGSKTSSTPSSSSQPVFATAVSYEPGQTELTPVTADNDPAPLSLPEGFVSAAPIVLQGPQKPAEPLGFGTPTKTWLILSVASHGAATFDAWSTRRNIEEGMTENNPLLRPFANSAAIYAATQVMPVAFDFLSKAMLHSSHPWVRKVWWVPQAGSTAASLVAGAHNMYIH